MKGKQQLKKNEVCKVSKFKIVIEVCGSDYIIKKLTDVHDVISCKIFMNNQSL